MENMYLFMLIALAVLAIADLVVGVSNDAVNFLNSAIGSKAISFRTIMIVASIGIAFGAMSSSGMMEVARKGIFHPEKFFFDEIAIIFMAVMITDILLLDFFNTLGLPTSTTVSIVFELLGAAVCISLLKIADLPDETFLNLPDYINGDKAWEIIKGILLSVGIAFTIGAIVQFVARLLLTFNFKQKPPLYAAVFGGLSISAILYFILVKGLKGANLGGLDLLSSVQSEPALFIAVSIGVWTLVSFILVQFFKVDIYRLIIVVGTFALATAFAGNDLVNFIGVPMAFLAGYNDWLASGVDASLYSMESLSERVEADKLLLLAAGIVMVLTLWFSSKARAVVKTSVDLSRQDSGTERFQPNWLSRRVVRYVIHASEAVNKIIPSKVHARIDKQYAGPTIVLPPKMLEDAPAFDMVRASVNLLVASVLISIATSLKLPLSTTYVTFMVAMGTSLADRAWGADSAVYRVAGVLNVIGGWFMTAISAFVAAALAAYIIYTFGFWAMVALIALAVILLVRNFLVHKRQVQDAVAVDQLRRAEASSIQGMIDESAGNIAMVFSRAGKIYNKSIDGVAREDLSQLKKNQKRSTALNTEIASLSNNLDYVIRKQQDESDGASRFYIDVLGYLRDVGARLGYIANVSSDYVNNNHRKLRFNQIRDLKRISEEFDSLTTQLATQFENRDYKALGPALARKKELIQDIAISIDAQIARTRADKDSSPKNTSLYFNILLETKELTVTLMELLQHYYVHQTDTNSEL